MICSGLNSVPFSIYYRLIFNNNTNSKTRKLKKDLDLYIKGYGLEGEIFVLWECHLVAELTVLHVNVVNRGFVQLY